MRVFVDSGIYMDYLKGKGVRLRVLKTFMDLLQQRKFKLIFPNITKEEIYKGIPLDRGRYSENRFNKLTIPAVPAGVEDSEKYKQAQELLNKYKEKIEEVRKKSMIAIDDIFVNYIEKLMESAEKIKEDQVVMEAAQVRRLKDNPPRKSTDPLGDEVAWELLLQKCTDENLAIIVHDEGWRYIDGKKTQLHPFLQKEWDEKKTGNKIELFSSLAPFIESIAPGRVTKKDIELEKKSALTYRGDEDKGFNFFTSPYLGVASPVSTPSISQWQPINVVGTPEMVQCYSCGRWVNKNNYYGFTSKGYACKFCLET